MSFNINPLFLGMNAWTTEQNLELDYVLKIILSALVFLDNKFGSYSFLKEC